MKSIIIHSHFCILLASKTIARVPGMAQHQKVGGRILVLADVASSVPSWFHSDDKPINYGQFYERFGMG